MKICYLLSLLFGFSILCSCRSDFIIRQITEKQVLCKNRKLITLISSSSCSPRTYWKVTCGKEVYLCYSGNQSYFEGKCSKLKGWKIKYLEKIMQEKL